MLADTVVAVTQDVPAGLHRLLPPAGIGGPGQQAIGAFRVVATIETATGDGQTVPGDQLFSKDWAAGADKHHEWYILKRERRPSGRFNLDIGR